MKNIYLLVLAAVLPLMTVAGCSSSDSNPGGGRANTQGVTKQTLTDAQFQKLLKADLTALIQLSLNGDLGSCRVTKISDYGCASSYPLYQVQLSDLGISYPSMGSGASKDSACLANTGADLLSALKEGYCYQNSTDFSELELQALTRKAYVGQLGQCRVEKYSSYGCGSGSPLYMIRFSRSGNVKLGTDGKPDTACFDSVASTLAPLYKAGVCD